MGVPFLYRYLVERFPTCCVPVTPLTVPDVDNLFLDLNGILHACTHATGAELDGIDPDCAPLSVAQRVMAGIIELVMMVNPQALLYVAIDGVAPRAKLNQQRSRRYKAANSNRKHSERGMEAGGLTRHTQGLSTLPFEESFDSNSITPGTVFMDEVAGHLKALLLQWRQASSRFSNLKVVLSTAATPGEGEHKIMDFLRETRHQRRVFGTDADLILLGLVARERHIIILREATGSRRNNLWGIRPSPPAWCPTPTTPMEYALSRWQTALQEECPGRPPVTWPLNRAHARGALDASPSPPYELFNIAVFRQCLTREFNHGVALDAAPPGFTLDTERCLDDFILLCILVGNDFLPAVPGFSILDNGLDVILDAYKANVAAVGYITHVGGSPTPATFAEGALWDIQWDRLEALLSAKAITHVEAAMTSTLLDAVTMLHDLTEGSPPPDGDDFDTDFDAEDNSWFLDEEASPALPAGGRAPHWKQEYYTNKLRVGAGDAPELVREYCVGLAWVLQYYYRGVPSWEWFYPHHYAPFVSDFVGLPGLMATPGAMAGWYTAPTDAPLLPLHQLLAVLPPDSAALMPAPLAAVMKGALAASYPDFDDLVEDVEDTDFDWQSVLQLPFVDAEALVAAATAAAGDLTPAEAARNAHADPFVLLGGDAEFRGVPHTELGAAMGGEPRVGTPTDGLPVFDTLPRAEDLPPGHVRPSWPSSYALRDEATRTTFRRGCVDVFGSRSQRASLVLEVPRPPLGATVGHLASVAPGVVPAALPPEGLTRGALAAVASVLMGKLVVVGDPYAMEGVVMQVVSAVGTAVLPACSRPGVQHSCRAADALLRDFPLDAHRQCYPPLDGAAVVTTPAVVLDDPDAPRALADMREEYIKRLGVDFGAEGEVMVRVRLLHSVLRHNTDAVGLVGAGVASVPLSQLVSPTRSSFAGELARVARPLLSPLLSTRTSVAPGSKVLLRRDGAPPMVATVTAAPSDDATVTVLPCAPPSAPTCRLPPTPPEYTTFTSGSAFFHDTGIERRGLYAIAGQCQMRYEAPAKGTVDVGLFLGVLSSSDSMFLPGYSRRAPTRAGEPEFSQVALALVQEYIAAFPAVLAAASTAARRIVIPARFLITPCPATASEMEVLAGQPCDEATAAAANLELDRVLEWLRAAPTFGLPRFHSDTVSAPMDMVLAVQGEGTPPVVTAGVAPPQVPFKVPLADVVPPAQACEQLCGAGSASFLYVPGDRVVLASGWAQAPLGALGTVVSVHGALLGSSDFRKPRQGGGGGGGAGEDAGVGDAQWRPQGVGVLLDDPTVLRLGGMAASCLGWVAHRTLIPVLPVGWLLPV